MKLRRYPNRTFRDLDQSRRVTLAEVGRALAEGGRLEVTDSKTGKDCTALVLTQLLYDLALKGEPLEVAPLAEVYRLWARSRPKRKPGDWARELEEAIFQAERGKLR